MTATTTIPTVQLIDPPDAKERHCPPRITNIDRNPINETQLINPNTKAGTYLHSTTSRQPTTYISAEERNSP
jgi:hypothetical protein